MTPILFEANETKFTDNGIGWLSDAISCVVTEEQNGSYELTMKYPISGIHFNEIMEERIILAEPFENGNWQPFIIYKISRALNGIVTIDAEHISSLLNKIVVMPYSAPSCASALTAIPLHTANNCPFTFTTDKDVEKTFYCEFPRPVRGMLGGEEGSILDAYGKGEYEFDRFNVHLYVNRGVDNGVTLRYGKNITELIRNSSIQYTYTGIVPYWRNEDELVALPEKVIYSDYRELFAHDIIRAVDFTNDFENPPTPEQLRQYAKTYLTNNRGWEISDKIKVSFIALWQTEEYKNIANIERVHMGDTVTVVYEALGVDAKMKVVRTVYDVLLERYQEIELGTKRNHLGAVLTEEISDKVAGKTTSFMQTAIDKATELIKGGKGGHLVIGTDADGKPNEIFLMDTDNVETAQYVLRINMNGIGFSSTGIDGRYTSAWTLDGAFVADFITAGTLNADLIKAGVLQSANGDNYWNLETGELHLATGTAVGNSTIASASDLEAVSNKKSTTYFQSGLPDNPTIGDLWVKTDDGNSLYRYNGTTWEIVDNADIQQALNDAADAQSTADSKIVTFAQATQPTATGTGDLWINTAEDNKIYRWDGVQWLAFRDGQIDKSEAAAKAYADTVAGKARDDANAATDQKLTWYATSSDLTVATNRITSQIEAVREESTTHYFFENTVLAGGSIWYYSTNPSAKDKYWFERMSDGSYRLVMDGTEMSAYGAYLQLRFDCFGAVNEIHLPIKFEFATTPTTLAKQRLYSFIYYNTQNGTGANGHYISIANGVVTDTDYAGNTTYLPDENGIYDAVVSKGKTVRDNAYEWINLYFVPGTKLYVYYLDCHTTTSQYSSAANSIIDQRLDGIELSVSQLEQTSKANYIPSSWADESLRDWYYSDEDVMPLIGTTYNGEPSMDFDGTNVTQDSYYLQVLPLNITQVGTYRYEFTATPSADLAAGLHIFGVYFCIANPDPDEVASRPVVWVLGAVNSRAKGAGVSEEYQGSFVIPSTYTYHGYTVSTELSAHEHYGTAGICFYYVSGTVMHYQGLRVFGSATDYAKSVISIAENMIQQEVTRATAAEGNLASRLSLTESGLQSRVSKGELISLINQSAEGVKIQASKISLEGIVTANSNFKILSDGSIEARNGKFVGTITGSVIQSAESGARVLMDTSSSIKGYNGNTLVNILNMSQSNQNQIQMTLDAKNQINIRAPKLGVVAASYGTGGGSASLAMTGSFDYVSSVTKYGANERSGIDEGYVQMHDDYGHYWNKYITLPVVLKVAYSRCSSVLGITTTAAYLSTNAI